MLYYRKDPNGNHLILEVEPRDKYYPRKTGLYNVKISAFEGFSDDKSP